METMDRNTQVRLELTKVEYDKLKAEQLQRIQFRDNLLMAHLTVTGAVISFIVANPKNDYIAYAYLLVPWTSSILLWAYLNNDTIISRIRDYIAIDLTEYITGLAQPFPSHLLGVLPPNPPDIMDSAALSSVSNSQDALALPVAALPFRWERKHQSDASRLVRKLVQMIMEVTTFILPAAGAYIRLRLVKPPPHHQLFPFFQYAAFTLVMGGLFAILWFNFSEIRKIKLKKLAFAATNHYFPKNKWNTNKQEKAGPDVGRSDNKPDATQLNEKQLIEKQLDANKQGASAVIAPKTKPNEPPQNEQALEKPTLHPPVKK